MSDEAARITFEKLNLGQMAQIVDERLLAYEQAIYDATLDMNLCLACDNDAGFTAQEKRVEDLASGLLFLRKERLALTAKMETHPVAEESETAVVETVET